MDHRGLVVAVCVTFLCTCARRAEVRETCDEAYRVVSCDGDNFGEESMWSDSCVDHVKDARRVGEACEAALLDLLECIGELSCSTIWSWREDKCGAMTEGHCGPHAAAFCAECPGVWYEPW